MTDRLMVERLAEMWELWMEKQLAVRKVFDKVVVWDSQMAVVKDNKTVEQ